MTNKENKIEGGIELHLRYVRMTDAEILALRAIRATVEANSQFFVDQFYNHLRSFEGTRAFLTDENVVRRLLDGQRKYLLSLCDAKFDQEYFQYRCLIGHTHFRLGLAFQWYIGAYCLYIDFLIPLVENHYANNTKMRQVTSSAIRKATLLDMSIVLEAYHEGDKAALEASKAQVLHQEKLAAVGLLASGLAHEIGNPLASIQAICENQLRKAVEPQAAEKFKRIRDQVTRITTIVRQLVNYARPPVVEWKHVNLNDVLESSLGIARLSRAAKSIDVKTHLAADLPFTMAVADQMGQVFLNLILNAIDSMQEDGGELRISTCAGPNKNILVIIEDNGHGISETNLNRIFTPFFTTKDVGKGTGLGLHVSIGIVRQHGGEIRVRSGVGTGTAFTVELPIRDKAQEPKIQ